MDNVNVDPYSTGKAPRRDKRDWRQSYDGPKTRRPAAKRQGTRQAVLAAHKREGGY